MLREREICDRLAKGRVEIRRSHASRLADWRADSGNRDGLEVRAELDCQINA
ncbi:MAG: hypothetical protein ABI629_09895 [bacterium]